MTEYVVRFSVRQRVEHAAVMILFLILAVTGFPQKFYDAGWASAFVDLIGGVGRLRWIHRASGIAFAVLSVFHLGALVFQAATNRVAMSMIPTRKDFGDVIQQLRYYLRLSETHARFDRFDYREKFEYWGLVFGGIIMVSTGFILYFPIAITRYLPGELIPVAKVAHSNEGLMAFLVVILWHVYNAHFAPDIFPFNKTIFTGRISIEHMRKEHPIEYERLFSSTAPEPEAPRHTAAEKEAGTGKPDA
jgi:cytochrome b subunit of formate dehydrogenase